MPKLDPDSDDVPIRTGSGYPPPYDAPTAGRRIVQLGRAGGLEDFGANLVTIPPGGWSSQRHWHEADDEFLWMVEGELVLIEDGGRTAMRAGDFAVFAKNTGNGHHLVNESSADARFVVIGANKGGAHYPDIDLRAEPDGGYRHKDGRRY